MVKLTRSNYACIYVGQRAILDMAFREFIQTSPKLSDAVKHRVLLGELILRGITPTDPTNVHALAVQFLMARGDK